VRTRINLNTTSGPEEAFWLLPQAGLETIGISEATEPGMADSQSSQPTPAMRKLAQQIPVQMIVSLGKVTLTLAEMNALKVGDYLPLDQAVFQPLEGRIDGRLHWIGKPCRLGNQQGFQIIAARNG
jgi:flagellar motor switch protein FliM